VPTRARTFEATWAAGAMISKQIVTNSIGVFRRWAKVNSAALVNWHLFTHQLLSKRQCGKFLAVGHCVILLIFSPLIVWRLSRPATALWFQLVSARDARKRHGGTWVWFIALWAIVGGVLQTIAAMK